MNDRSVYPLGKRRTLIVFFGLMLGMLLAALDQTIVSTALPRITQDLGGFEHYSWVFSAYMLGATVTVPLYGKLSDIYGRRPLFLIGIAPLLHGVDHLRPLCLDGDAHRRPCHPGARSRRPYPARRRGDRRHHPAAVAWKMAGRHGRGLRRVLRARALRSAAG